MAKGSDVLPEAGKDAPAVPRLMRSGRAGLCAAGTEAECTPHRLGPAGDRPGIIGGTMPTRSSGAKEIAMRAGRLHVEVMYDAKWAQLVQFTHLHHAKETCRGQETAEGGGDR